MNKGSAGEKLENCLVLVGGHLWPFEAVLRRGKSGKDFVEIGRQSNLNLWMERLYTIKEAAEYLRLGESTLRRYLRRKLIRRIILPGGDQRIREKDLKNFLDDREV